MGAYTWTFVRIDKLNKEQLKGVIDYAIWSSKGTTYGTYSKLPEEEYIKKWIKLHLNNYDYFVNECGVPKEKMTEEYLTKEIKGRMKKWFYMQKCYQKCLEGTMAFEEMVRKTHQLTERSSINDFYIIKRKGHYYVNIKNEIFRNYEYTEEEFSTVKSLIEHLENPKCKSICDFTDELKDSLQPEYGPLSEKLKEKIIKYYEAIGDGNFIVHFR